jgi:Na+/proline symporter
MNVTDWLVIAAYMALVVGLAAYLTRKQKDTQDYYLAGKKIKWCGSLRSYLLFLTVFLSY